MKLWIIYPSIRDTCYALRRRDLGKFIETMWRVVMCLEEHPDFIKYKKHPAVLAFNGDLKVAYYILRNAVETWNGSFVKVNLAGMKTKHGLAKKQHGLTEEVEKRRSKYKMPPTGAHNLPAGYLLNATEWHRRVRLFYYERINKSGHPVSPYFLNDLRRKVIPFQKYQWPKPPAVKQSDPLNPYVVSGGSQTFRFSNTTATI